MDFEDLVTALEPPPNRVGKSDDLHEHHLYEGAVMLAYAMYLLRTQGARDVRIHPDGEHGKQFDFTSWLGGKRSPRSPASVAPPIRTESEGRTVRL
ncbi:MULTISPECIES: hypothetical protein [Bradyrhizobium]|uniref:hypothetical protein n=1 Tax=Bradyrhizobium TaxID=374 RepID=UPI0019310727|nr:MULTISPECIES: hypothetical protein [Bradyrhizobium]